MAWTPSYKKPKQRATVAARIPTELKAELEMVAETHNLTVSDYLGRLIVKALDEELGPHLPRCKITTVKTDIGEHIVMEGRPSR